MAYVKDFDGWNTIKQRINDKETFPTVNQREIWWASLGVNVGNEEDGKGEIYSRPVLVIRKFDRFVFLGVPLTTQVKDKWHYHKIHLHGKEQCVMLMQMKLFDVRRLTSTLGKLSQTQFDAIRAKLKDMI